MEHLCSKTSMQFIESKTVTAYGDEDTLPTFAVTGMSPSKDQQQMAALGEPDLLCRWTPPGKCTSKDEVICWSEVGGWIPSQTAQSVWDSTLIGRTINFSYQMLWEAHGVAEESSMVGYADGNVSNSRIDAGLNPCSAYHQEQMLRSCSEATVDVDSIDSQMSAISLEEHPCSDAAMTSPIHEPLRQYKEDSDSLWLSAHSILYHYKLDDPMLSNLQEQSRAEMVALWVSLHPHGRWIACKSLTTFAPWAS
ncbi:hypothetical protein V8B97DRAFT_1920532 [Scleroderma yunnanense]